MVIDLPEPDLPNKAVMPASFSKATSRSKGAEFQRNFNADHAEPAIPILIKAQHSGHNTLAPRRFGHFRRA
jgi:hypothetical protein